MTNEDLYKNRYSIVFDALSVGLKISYKRGWVLFSKKGEVFQSIYSEELSREVTHKTAICLSDFMNFINEMNCTILKQLYGDIRLSRLQDKLTKDKNDESGTPE